MSLLMRWVLTRIRIIGVYDLLLQNVVNQLSSGSMLLQLTWL